MQELLGSSLQRSLDLSVGLVLHDLLDQRVSLFLGPLGDDAAGLQDGRRGDGELIKAEADEDREAEAALAKDYTGVTVLVVDDTMLNLWLAERNLEKYGFSVKKAESGVEALEILEKAIPGEIDLILREGEELVFCEVKYRTSLAYGTPADAVDTRKRMRLRLTAEAYCQERNISDRPMRFDVVEILQMNGRRYIRTIRNAF